MLFLNPEKNKKQTNNYSTYILGMVTRRGHVRFT